MKVSSSKKSKLIRYITISFYSIIIKLYSIIKNSYLIPPINLQNQAFDLH